MTANNTHDDGWVRRAAMDDVRAKLQAAEEEARQQATSLRQRARRLRLRGFGDLADELEAHAVWGSKRRRPSSPHSLRACLRPARRRGARAARKPHETVATPTLRDVGVGL